MAESVRADLLEAAARYKEFTGKKPDSILLGEEVAERLWAETFPLTLQTPVSLESFKARIEAGTVALEGMWLEAGWPHG